MAWLLVQTVSVGVIVGGHGGYCWQKINENFNFLIFFCSLSYIIFIIKKKYFHVGGKEFSGF